MLKPKQLKAIELLAKGKSQTQVAKEIGVSDRTLRNWLKDEEFLKALKEKQKQVLEEFVLSLIEMEEDIDETLKETIERIKEGIRTIEPSSPQALNALCVAFKALLEYRQKQKEFALKVWERKKKEEEDELKKKLGELEKRIEVVIRELSDGNKED